MSDGKAKRGRPERLTDDVKQKILLALSKGAYLETAAAFAGVSRSAFFDWLKKGRETNKDGEHVGEKKYVDFAFEVDQEVAKQEVDMLDTLGMAAKSDTRAWAAAAWRLERRFKDRYAPKVATEADPTEDEELDDYDVWSEGLDDPEKEKPDE